MLKNIPGLFTPQILRVMMEMGHGDRLLLCDANYPNAQGGGERIDLPHADIRELLEMVLYFFPLDRSVECAAAVMESCREGARYEQYRSLVEINGSKLVTVERFAFYRQAERAAARIVTADMTRGGNILLTKGVVTPDDLPF